MNEENEQAEGYFAIFCSGMLLIVAAFALIGAVAVCRWFIAL